MPLSQIERTQVVRLLLQDVQATIGQGHESVVNETAAHIATFMEDPIGFRDTLVEHVQQLFHDGFVDTTWPACPRHRQHPLWLRGDHWCCERTGEIIARLGELGSAGNHGRVG